MQLKTRRIRHVDIVCPIENELVQTGTGFYSIYVIQPEESGTLFTASGPGHLTRGQLIMILPPIYEFGEGMEFGFKLGPYTSVQLYTHEGFSYFGASWHGEFHSKGYMTHDVFLGYAGSGHGLDTCGWGIHVDRTNATRWFRSMTNPTPPPSNFLNGAYRDPAETYIGGYWASIQDEANFNPSIYAGDGSHTSGGSYDWYNYCVAYSPDGLGILARNETYPERVVNMTQSSYRKFYYYNVVDPAKPQIDITDAKYSLTADQTESIVTNQGAVQDVQVTLPPAEPGLHFWFQTKIDKVAGQYKYFTIVANEGDYIQAWHSIGGYDNQKAVYNSGINRQIQLLAVNDTDWHFMHQIPEWVPGDPYGCHPPATRSYFYPVSDLVLSATDVYNSGIIDSINAHKNIDITLPLNAIRGKHKYIFYSEAGYRTTIHPPYGSGDTISYYGDNNDITMTGIYSGATRLVTAIYSVGSGVWHYIWNWNGSNYWGTQPEGLWP